MAPVAHNQTTADLNTSRMRRWCSGSGVPGDHLEAGHHVEPEWQAHAWLSDDRLRTVYRTRARCKRCDKRRKHWLKAQDPYIEKARNTIKHHVSRYAKRFDCGLSEARRCLLALGWTVEAVAQKFRDAEALLCGCRDSNGDPWTWDKGDHDMTLDIDTPSLPWVLESNTSVMCRTCNSSKGERSKTEFLGERAYFDHCEHLSTWVPSLFDTAEYSADAAVVEPHASPAPRSAAAA